MTGAGVLRSISQREWEHQGEDSSPTTSGETHKAEAQQKRRAGFGDDDQDVG